MVDFLKAWRKLRVPVYLLVFTLMMGTAGYKFFFPEVPFLKLMFMTGITLSTVGYGDILGVESNPWAIIYTMFLMLLGMGTVLYSTSLVTAFILEGNLKHAFALERLRRRIRKMRDHYIICGAGETGIHVVREMIHTGQNFVVIDNSEVKQNELLKDFPDVPVILGDATLDQTLAKANIHQAKGLVACLSNDKDNLFLTVSARMLASEVTIVAKAVELNMIKKLRKAGAEYVVSPNFIGGMRIASEILRPNVVSFLDRMLRGKDKSIRVEEVTIPPFSKLVGKTIGQADIYKKAGVNIIALGKDKETYHYNPAPTEILQTGDVLLYIANAEQEKTLRDLVRPD